MRARAIALALVLTAACGNPGAPANQPADVAAPPPVARPAPAPAPREAETPPPDPAALEGLSPSQRRAYDRGYRDCRAGRYAPEHYPEAYRIGCAAAQDQGLAAR